MDGVGKRMAKTPVRTAPLLPMLSGANFVSAVCDIVAQLACPLRILCAEGHCRRYSHQLGRGTVALYGGRHDTVAKDHRRRAETFSSVGGPRTRCRLRRSACANCGPVEQSTNADGTANPGSAPRRTSTGDHQLGSELVLLARRRLTEHRQVCRPARCT